MNARQSKKKSKNKKSINDLLDDMLNHLDKMVSVIKPNNKN